MEGVRHRWRRWAFMVLLMAASVTSLEDYLCPRQCDCSYMMRDSMRELEITCFVEHVKAFNYGSLSNVVEPYSLIMNCDSAVPNELSNTMFSALHSCDVISFHKCKFSYIHRHVFAGFRALRKIVIDQAANVQLELHPSVFQNLPDITALSVTNSGVTKVPDLCGLKGLQSANFSGNSLAQLKDAGIVCNSSENLPSLTSMDLSQNSIDLLSVLEHIGASFLKLEHLYLADNQIEMSDNENPFRAFGLLRTLDLHGNRISRMPAALLQNNREIRDIDLSHNHIQRIPDDLFFYSTSLLSLNLGDNQLDDAVWIRLGFIRTLMHLDLSGNKLTQVDPQIISQLVELSVLKLSSNAIETLPQRTFQNQIRLQELNLADNNLQSLDKEALYGMLYLTKLELQNNKLSFIHKDFLRSVTTLLHLNVSSNSLQALPSLSRLPSLLVLDADNNMLQILPEGTFIGQTNIRDIHLSQNQIRTLSDKLFLSCTLLEELDLSHNLIDTIHPGTFVNLPVQKLYLNGNRLHAIGKTFSNLHSLRVLKLENNLISDIIQRYMFPKTLEILDLSLNNIAQIRNYAFDGMNKIRLVNLRYNNIQTLSDVSLAVSTGLYAQTGFLIDKNPLRCDCELLWLKTWKQSPHGTVIDNLNTTECSGAYRYPTAPIQTVPADRFLCQYNVLCPLSCPCCEYMACDCRYECPPGCTCHRSADYGSIHYVNCSLQNLTSIHRFIPRLATQVDFSGNDLEELPSHSFIGMNNLSTLFLNSSRIITVGNRSFSGLSSLKALYLNDNMLESLHEDMFEGLVSLQELYMDHNRISSLPTGVFDQLVYLSVLTLSSNDLQYMDDYTSHLVYRVKTLALYNNDWVCDCILYASAKHNLAAFLTSVTSPPSIGHVNCSVSSNGYKVTLASYRDICEDDRYNVQSDHATKGIENIIRIFENGTDTSRNRSLLSNKRHYEVTRQDLSDKFENSRLRIFIPVMLASTLIFILVVTVACRKEFIRFWLFTKFRCKSKSREILYDKTRNYDAFVTYSLRDDNYVIRELALKLERGKPRYRLLLQHRDHERGCSVPGFIETGVRTCHRTIMVISPDFTDDSPWLNFVTDCVKQDSIRRLIIVVLGKVEVSKLDPVLKSYMRSDYCIHYGDSWFWEKLHYCLPEPRRSARETSPLTHPYASTDLARFSSAMMDNAAYEEPVSVTSRPLPTIDEYVPSLSQSYDYAGGSGTDSNIYEEIKDPPDHDPSGGYCQPWRQIYFEGPTETDILTSTKEV